jgi:hypothetical protein
LTLEAYVAAGLPAPDRAWGANDYDTANAALGRIVSRDPGALPRLASPRSRAAFLRMVDPTNLEPPRKAPAGQRGLTLGMLGSGAGKISMLYMRAGSQGEDVSRELLALMSFAVRAMAGALDAFDELWDAGRPLNEDGWAHVQHGAAESVAGALTTLTERDFYAAADRAKLADDLGETLPVLVAHLTPLSRTEMMGRLRALANDETDPLLAPALRALAEKTTRRLGP